MRPDARLNYSRMDARRGQLRESDSGRGRRIIRAVGASNKVLQDPRRRHLNGGVCVWDAANLSRCVIARSLRNTTLTAMVARTGWAGMWLLPWPPTQAANSRLEHMWSNSSDIAFGHTCRPHVQEPSESPGARAGRQENLAARRSRHGGHPYLQVSTPKASEGMLVKVCMP